MTSTSQDTGDQRDNRRRLLILVGFCGLLFLFGLGSRALWDVDEGMHSAIAKHVVDSGDWVTPTYNGEAFFDKPMFFTWLVAVSFSILGFTELAARLPAAVVGLAGVLVTYFLGRRMFGARAGLLGGTILSTSVLYLVLSRTVVHDIALGLFTTLALYLFYRGVVDESARRKCFLLFYVAVAGAVLSKGPLGAVLPALVIGPFLLLTRRMKLIREMQLGWGLLVLVVIAAPWYVLMSLRNEGYLAYFLVEKSFGSFTSVESTHPAPFHFYLPVFIGALLPWSGFLPVAIYRAMRGLRSERGEALLYLLLWVGGMFLFFSLAASKLASYLLPLMPAAALLLALPWNDLLSSPTRRLQRRLVWSLASVFGVMVAAAGYGWLDPPVELESKYGLTLVQLASVALVIAGVLGLAVGLLVKGRFKASFVSLAAMVAVVVVMFASWLGPVMDPYRSTKALALEVDRMLRPGEPIRFFWREKDSALFYTDRDGVVVPTWEVEGYLATDGAVLLVADVRHLDRILDLRERFAFVRKLGSKVVLSNQPEDEQLAAIPDRLKPPATKQ